MEPNQYPYGQPGFGQPVAPTSGGLPPVQPVPQAQPGQSFPAAAVLPLTFEQPAAATYQPPQAYQPPVASQSQSYQPPVSPQTQPQASASPYQSQSQPRSVITNPVMYHMGPTSIKKRLKTIVGLLLAAAVFIAGAILISGWLRQPGRYQQLQQVSVEDTGSITDGHYTLEIPKEFEIDQTDADSLMYVHMASKKPNAEVLARLSATAVFAGEDNIADLRTELSNQAAQQSGAVYEGFVVDHIKAILSDLDGQLTPDTFSEGVASGDKPTIGADYTYKKTDGTEFKGRIMIIFGEKHMYILTAVSGTDRWNSNSEIWDTVFKSFTVDTSPAKQ